MVEELSTTDLPSNEAVLKLLRNVHDPEIPTLSIVDLGIVRAVDTDAGKVRVTITPTFVGCPALETIKSSIVSELLANGHSEVEVRVDFSTAWSSNLITDAGREALHKHGLALPPKFEGELEPEIMLNAQCPFCGSTNTTLKSVFGAALCRAFYFCKSCSQGFEQFKPV